MPPAYTKSLSYRSLPDGSIAATLVLRFANGGRRTFTERLTAGDTRSAAAAWAQEDGVPGAVAVSGAAVVRTPQWWWEQYEAKALGKRRDDKKALQWWWNQKLNRSSRATMRAILAEGPAGMTPPQLNRWWAGQSVSRRKARRARHGGESGNFLSDALNVAVRVAVPAVALGDAIAKANIPLLSDAARASNVLQTLPFKAAESIARGERVDKVALNSFKRALSASETLAPYVQTVVSFIPGIGTGLSAAIGGALALAQGKSLDAALIAAIRSAVPGGPIAQAAFDVAVAAAQGKPIEQIALNALPVSPAAKDALLRGASAVRGLASGKRVDEVVLDEAVKLLPPAAREAAQVAVAVAHGKSLQQAAAQHVLGPAVKKLAGAKVMQAAERALKSGAGAVASGAARELGTAAKLVMADAAVSVGARRAARRLVRDAKGRLDGTPLPDARAVYDLARRTQENINALANGKRAPVQTAQVIALARAGKVQSNQRGSVSERELAAAMRDGRVFFVRAAA